MSREAALSGSMVHPATRNPPGTAVTASRDPKGPFGLLGTRVDPNQSVNVRQKLRLPYAEQPSPVP